MILPFVPLELLADTPWPTAGTEGNVSLFAELLNRSGVPVLLECVSRAPFVTTLVGAHKSHADVALLLTVQELPPRYADARRGRQRAVRHEPLPDLQGHPADVRLDRFEPADRG